MRKKRIYTNWEYDDDNEIIRVFKNGVEIDGVELSCLVEDWLKEQGYKI